MNTGIEYVGQCHTAYDRRKYCICGSHEYIVWRSKVEPTLWSVSCFNCGRTTKEYETKREALKAWRKL